MKTFFQTILQTMNFWSHLWVTFNYTLDCLTFKGGESESFGGTPDIVLWDRGREGYYEGSAYLCKSGGWGENKGILLLMNSFSEQILLIYKLSKGFGTISKTSFALSLNSTIQQNFPFTLRLPLNLKRLIKSQA